MAAAVANFQPTLDPVAVIDDEQLSVADAVDRYFASPEAELTAGDPSLLTRKQKQDRAGLPAAGDLLKLAKVWLEAAHRLWPALAAAGVLPPLGNATVERLAADFMRRFLTGRPDAFVTRSTRSAWKALAASYLRYSDDNSNPRSLNDQLARQLNRAAAEGRFLPWEYVFADASVTGRTHLRRGYRLAKEAMERFGASELDTLYFDEFSRATRSMIESYRLEKLMERLRRRLIGMDGFDNSVPHYESQVTLAGMFNSMFVRQLRDKVVRGMKGAASRGTSTGKVRFGFKLVPLLGPDGRPVMHSGKAKEHKPVMVPAIDEEAMPLVVQAARWFGEDHKAYHWIARQFNLMRVGGRTRWTASHVRQILACPAYIGVFIYNRTRTYFDEETGEFSVQPNPRSEWVIRVDRTLRGWDDELWKKVRRRAAYVRDCAPNTGKKYVRSEVYPAALLHGTLVCGSCGAEIGLIRSDTKKGYRQYGCPNGCGHVNGCTMGSSKSAQIVDGAVLRWVADKVLTLEGIAALEEAANRYLKAEAARPLVPTAGLRQQLRSALAEEQRIADLVLRGHFRTMHGKL